MIAADGILDDVDGNGTPETLGRRYYYHDHLGSVRAISDTIGTKRQEFDYWPYGENMYSHEYNEDTYRYTGHERDYDLGMDYMHARHYFTETGRFMSVDIRNGRRSQPQSFNLYGYTVVNPLNYFDPTGEESTYYIVGPKSWKRLATVELLGHAVLHVTSGERSAGVSYGGKKYREQGSRFKLKDFVNAYTSQGHPILKVTLSTTEAQDNRMIDFILEDPQLGTGGFHAAFGNCSTAVGNTLEAGEVVPTASNPGGFFGITTPSSLLLSLIFQGLVERIDTIPAQDDSSSQDTNTSDENPDFVGPPPPDIVR